MREERDTLEQQVKKRRDEFSKRKRQINDIDYEKSKLNIELQRDTIKL